MRRTELHQLQAELRAAEAQLDAAVSGHSEALGAHGRLTSSVSALEVELAQARAARAASLEGELDLRDLLGCVGPAPRRAPPGEGRV